MPKVGIYKVTNPIGQIYIGKSIDIDRRFNAYRRLTNCKSQRRLYNSLKKYSPENHIFEILEECKISDLNYRESYYISLYNSMDSCFGLNLISGGGGGSFLCEESKKIMSIKRKGPGNAFFGKKHTKESLQAIQKTRKNIGVKAPNWNVNNRVALSIKKGGKTVIQYDLNGNFIREWTHLRAIESELKIPHGAVSKVCRGIWNYAGGYIWKYK
jgi:group I intron endonuclease